MLGVAILPADIQDRDGCLPALKKVRRLFPFLRRIIADGAYQGTDTACAVRQAAGAPLQIVKRSVNRRPNVDRDRRPNVDHPSG